MQRSLRIIVWLALILLALAAPSLWVRSHYRHNSLAWQTSSHSYVFASASGRVGVVRSTTLWAGGGGWPRFATYGRDRSTGGVLDGIDTSAETRRILGFRYGAGRIFWQSPGQWFVVPDWALALIAAAPLTIALVRRLRRRHRVAANLCTNCGYDLRATPDRCPECGTLVTT